MLVDWLSLNQKYILQSNSWENLYLNLTEEILQNIIFTRLVYTKPDNELYSTVAYIFNGLRLRMLSSWSEMLHLL